MGLGIWNGVKAARVANVDRTENAVNVPSAASVVNVTRCVRAGLASLLVRVGLGCVGSAGRRCTAAADRGMSGCVVMSAGLVGVLVMGFGVGFLVVGAVK